MIFENKTRAIYKNMLIRRYDDFGVTRYFTHEDFSGLKKEEFSFTGDKGQKLVGGFYYYGEKRTDLLVIFEHGLGGGHLAYTVEIERLTKNGYTVFSYDKTGCMQSEGESILSITQAVKDCNLAIHAVKSLEEYKNAKIYIVGHSWGAFTAMNVLSINAQIDKIVAISGMISVRGLIKGYLKGPLSLLISNVEKFEEELNPGLGYLNAVDSLNDSDVEALIIHSVDDKTVSFKHNFAVLKRKINRDGVRFLSTTGKIHNPTYTEDAVKILNDYFENLQRKIKKKELETAEQKKAFLDGYDFKAMTVQDDSVWNEIINFLG